MPGRTGADRRLGTRLVRGSWREVHAAGIRRRRYQQVDAAAVRCLGIGVRLLPRDTRLSGGSRQAGCLLQRQNGIFRVNAKEALGGDRITQFGRVLSELNIDIICANSPQAKGRIERAFGTLQDRLVKELRLAGISTVTAANAWLPGFITGYNARFGRQPQNAKDLHRPLTSADNLDEIVVWREERTVTLNLTLHYDRMMLLLDPTPFARGLVRKKVD